MYNFGINIFFCAFCVCAAVGSFERDVPAFIWSNMYEEFIQITIQRHRVY